MDSIFGLSEKALQLCEDRSVLLSDNVVNSSTPNYKARDIDFQKVLQQEQTNQNSLPDTSHPGDLTMSNALHNASVLYRVPMQKSLDGNTVDENLERKDFIENAINYQVNLTFVQSKSDQLMKAIKGE